MKEHALRNARVVLLHLPWLVPMGRWRALAARCLNPRGGGVTLPSRLRNALFVLFIGGILAYGPGSPGTCSPASISST